VRQSTSGGGVRVGRVYDAPSPADGRRILVDRLWPRGISKETADLDDWLKEIAPSNDLRHWYGHDPGRFEEFKARYEAELQTAERAAALETIKAAARREVVTLLTATKEVPLSHAAFLATLVQSAD
jgi:uncharacterized protein YeaO (DUF488 family)